MVLRCKRGTRNKKNGNEHTEQGKTKMGTKPRMGNGVSYKVRSAFSSVFIRYSCSLFFPRSLLPVPEDGSSLLSLKRNYCYLKSLLYDHAPLILIYWRSTTGKKIWLSIHPRNFGHVTARTSAPQGSQCEIF